MGTLTVRDLYRLMVNEYGDADPFNLAARGDRWVMDLNGYRQVRAACRAADALVADDGLDEPGPHDQLFGVPVEVREDGGAPHLERAPTGGRR